MTIIGNLYNLNRIWCLSVNWTDMIRNTSGCHRLSGNEDIVTVTDALLCKEASGKCMMHVMRYQPLVPWERRRAQTPQNTPHFCWCHIRHIIHIISRSNRIKSSNTDISYRGLFRLKAHGIMKVLFLNVCWMFNI